MSKPATKTKTILIIEDDRQNRNTFVEILQKGGYRVYEASSAEEAISYLYTRLRPDLILLDLGLPDKGGEQLTAEIKGNMLFAQIPIVVISGNLALAKKTSDWAAMFHKPVKSEEVLNEISRILNKSDSNQ